MSSTTVHVHKISGQTSEKEVRDFFSFCGKISNLSITKEADGNQSAAVTFEKPTASKTALLLDNTQLGPNLVEVTSSASLEELSSDKSGAGAEPAGDTVDQEDKPRSRILAEYLAQGYVVSDKAIERAIALDNQHGFSARFTAALQNWDNKLKATEKAQTVDQKLGVTDKAVQGWHSLNSYFEKAMGTQSGQKLLDFYKAGNKQVMDVHTEARRLADLKSNKAPSQPVAGSDKTTCNCGGDTGICSCEPGKCACSSCPRNAGVASSSVSAEAANMEKIEGTDKTKCNCGGKTGVCPCEPGKCACAGCDKNPEVAVTA